ncbi:teichoic acid D-Ala incorporation-associated protein DltX [Weissella muntiaci]|uniref:Teichoic acid D-Ala incorporation-associated protein DltX n=1 Tax=Weissella muntiaci TaxID=2508881 RepID=A0A6C2C7I6_9LACO|nr:teichoic acid D-Ala incorporation-associated protein DltX [Weissella muntiaci]TYC49807.1 teichoic acid D-Ala incorporation-associated protein DltX [Weissella muntiaci]
MDNRQILRFIALTIFYVVIILVLIYFYSYAVTGPEHFIYNEF